MWLTPCSRRNSRVLSASAWETSDSAAAPKMTLELSCPVLPNGALAITARDESRRLQPAGRREAIEDAPDLREHAWDEVLERTCVLEAADAHGVVAGVADQLLRDRAGLLVGGIEAARLVALLADLVVEHREVRVERLG